ncbi:MAG: RNA polymerase sigma factor [Cyclobacteriaceae bacterium]
MQAKAYLTNAELVEKLRKSDIRAFDTIFYRFKPKLYVFTMKLTHNPEDAKEVVQEVFLKVWERRELIKPYQNLDSYLFTIAKNLVYNKARRRAYWVAYQEYINSLGISAERFTENTVQYNELVMFLEGSCQQLPPVRQKVFTLSRVDGLSHDEIAEQLNTSTSNVKNHIHKALRFLKEQMQLHEIIPAIIFSLAHLPF